MKVHKLWAAVGTALAVLAPAIAVVVAQPAQAQTYSVLYAFGYNHGKHVSAGLVLDKKGDLYGTTVEGGVYRFGVVFKLKANGKQKVLHSFTGGADGANPYAGLIRDTAGNLYGTTSAGGAYGVGVVFKLDTAGAETVLYSFTGGADGGNPYPGLVRDSAGNLYGTTSAGGAYGAGVVFKLDAGGAYTVLHSFTGGADGANPYAGLIRDTAGNLYGTTLAGGAYGAGVVFKLDAGGAYTVLHTFTGGADGASPYAGLLRTSTGNLYGTTSAGGASNRGVIFKLKANGKESVLHSFYWEGGIVPVAGLVRDSAGNLYGTTPAGGFYKEGVVFKLDATGTETVLHDFSGFPYDGGNARAGLVRDKAGNLYGTTWWEGEHDGGGVQDHPAMTNGRTCAVPVSAGAALLTANLGDRGRIHTGRRRGGGTR